jgi:hypothetical protein
MFARVVFNVEPSPELAIELADGQWLAIELIE